MGLALEPMGAFKGQQISVTPLIGNLRFHVQGYVDQENFYISSLLHKDVILGAPWFHHMVAQLKFPKRVITFTHRGREIRIKTKDKGNMIPLVSHEAIQKPIKSSICIFVKILFPLTPLESLMLIYILTLKKIIYLSLNNIVIVSLTLFLMSCLPHEAMMS